MKCNSCGKKLTKHDLSLNKDICQSCVSDLAEEIDREMLGDDYDHFETSGYFEDHGYFGDK
jgi:hypothetical protein